MNEIVYKNKKYEVFVKDNKASITAFYIHGYNSDLEFAKPVYDKQNNYNVVAFSYPAIKNDEDLSLDEYIEVAHHVFSKIKNSRVFVVGHSLGGYVASEIGRKKKVQKIIYVAPIHPMIWDTNMFKYLRTAYNEKSVLTKVIGSLIKQSVKTVNSINKTGAFHFVDLNNPWHKIVKNDLTNKNKIMHRLNENMILTKTKSMYLCGDKDMVISQKDLKEYVEETLNLPLEIVTALHNPFKEATSATKSFIENQIPFKKRFLSSWRKIFKK